MNEIWPGLKTEFHAYMGLKTKKKKQLSQHEGLNQTLSLVQCNLIIVTSFI